MAHSKQPREASGIMSTMRGFAKRAKSFVFGADTLVLPRYPNGVVIPSEETILVRNHLRAAVDQLLAIGVSHHSVQLGCASLCLYAEAIKEARKKARLAAEATARKLADMEANTHGDNKSGNSEV